VKEIRSLISSFAEEQQCVCLFGQGCLCRQVCFRSIATALNTLGARLLHATNTISSSTLAGQFMEVFQNEAGSMKPEKAIYCVLHQQDEFPHLQHHHKLFGFPFSQHTCPRETQLAVSPFKALFRPSGYGLWPAAAVIEPTVSILCHKPMMNFTLCTYFSKVHEIEKNWGIDLAGDQRLILPSERSALTQVWKTLVT